MLKQTFIPISYNIESAFLNLCVACIYIVTGLIGQQFAIAPGNITPIWLPSGIMFALTLKFGAKIWPGIFLGAFFGNVWAYFSLSSLKTSLAAVFAASFNGLGDVFAIVSMVVLLLRFTHSKSPFEHSHSFFNFVALGAVVGPFISALFGVTSLVAAGFINAESYGYSLTNWWIGDGVGVLLFAPLLYSLLNPQRDKVNLLYLSICLCFACVLSATVFELINPTYLFIKLIAILTPALFALMLFSGQQVVYLVQLCIVIIAVYATYIGKGPFINAQILSPLVDLQLFIAVLSMIVFVLALLVEQKRKMFNVLSRQKRELELLYRHDKLTQLWNRYGIEEFLQLDLLRAVRSKHPFSLMIIDIDDFKQVNDKYGHLTGDQVLKALADLLTDQTRKGDLVGRWGGEEFIIISTEVELKKVQQMACKLVELVKKYNFRLNQPLTISIGYTLYQPGDDEQSLIARADKGLYLSKNNGKNQATYAS